MRLLAILLFLPMVAYGAIARTQNVQATGTSVAITSTANGDMIVVWANSTTTTIPSLPAGFTNIVGTAATASAARLGYKISTGGDTSSGTWTNAAQVVCMVYSGAGGFGTTPTLNAGNGTVLTYSAVTLQDTSGASWVLGFGGAGNATAGMNGTPTGTAPNLGNRIAGLKVNGCDTGAGISSNFTAQTLTVTGTGRWLTATVELKVPSVTPTGTGNFFRFFTP